MSRNGRVDICVERHISNKYQLIRTRVYKITKINICGMKFMRKKVVFKFQTSDILSTFIWLTPTNT